MLGLTPQIAKNAFNSVINHSYNTAEGLYWQYIHDSKAIDDPEKLVVPQFDDLQNEGVIKASWESETIDPTAQTEQIDQDSKNWNKAESHGMKEDALSPEMNKQSHSDQKVEHPAADTFDPILGKLEKDGHKEDIQETKREIDQMEDPEEGSSRLVIPTEIELELDPYEEENYLYPYEDKLTEAGEEGNPRRDSFGDTAEGNDSFDEDPYEDGEGDDRLHDDDNNAEKVVDDLDDDPYEEEDEKVKVDLDEDPYEDLDSDSEIPIKEEL